MFRIIYWLESWTAGVFHTQRTSTRFRSALHSETGHTHSFSVQWHWPMLVPRECQLVLVQPYSYFSERYEIISTLARTSRSVVALMNGRLALVTAFKGPVGFWFWKKHSPANGYHWALKCAQSRFASDKTVLGLVLLVFKSTCPICSDPVTHISVQN